MPQLLPQHLVAKDRVRADIVWLLPKFSRLSSSNAADEIVSLRTSLFVRRQLLSVTMLKGLLRVTERAFDAVARVEIMANHAFTACLVKL